ncbi:hypothetical protein [Nitrincola sp. MINF-07-Sa-05]|uniref:hypothetical protein n=1 Tax=Nitrincola salilacus TaxID=3400273 RepID=UPI0039181995
MARYKHYDYNQTKMIPLRFADQLPGRQYCRDCVLKHQCLRRENQLDGRQVSFTLGDFKMSNQAGSL